MVTETYPPEINGVAVTMLNIIDELRRRGHEVAIVRPRQHAADTPASDERLAEILVRGIPIPRYDGLRFGLPAGRLLARVWREQPPDVVHIVTEGPLGASAITAAHRLGIPVTSDFHTNFHSYSRDYGAAWLKTPIAAYLRRLHNRTRVTMVPTATTHDELAGLGFDNLRVVARGVNTGLFNPARRSAALRASWGVGPDDPVVLSVGRMAAEKNLPLVVRAYDAMRMVNPRARLVFVGDGPVRRRLQRDHPHHVYAGMRTGEDLAAHYASADIFLFPSTSETYGNVTVEAMASGLAVVAYDYAAATEHIRHEHNGLALPFDDADAFVRASSALVNDGSRTRRLGANAHATTAALDWSMRVHEFEAALLEFAAEEVGDAVASELSA